MDGQWGLFSSCLRGKIESATCEFPYKPIFTFWVFLSLHELLENKNGLGNVCVPSGTAAIRNLSPIPTSPPLCHCPWRPESKDYQKKTKINRKFIWFSLRFIAFPSFLPISKINGWEPELKENQTSFVLEKRRGKLLAKVRRRERAQKNLEFRTLD